MSIRILNNGGNSALNITPSFDECVIQSVENREQVSFITDMKNGEPMYKRLRNDDEVIEYIANMYVNDEISSIEMDEANHDIIIRLRQLGDEPLDVGEISTVIPEVIEI